MKASDLLIWNEPRMKFCVGFIATLSFLIGSFLATSPAKCESWESIKQFFTPPAEYQGDMGDFQSPLLFSDGTPVQSAADWKMRRQEILDDWESYMGEWPPLITDPEVEVLETTKRENFEQLKIRFTLLGDTKTDAYLLLPEGKGPHPAVLVLYYDPETGIGKGTPNRDFALQLTRRGFVTLSVGICKGEKPYEHDDYVVYYPSIENAEVEPMTILAYEAANAWYVLASRPEVDSERIGVVGHSYGGKWALFASCMFDKFACAAWSDPGIVFDASRTLVNYWHPWYLGYYPPPWPPHAEMTAENTTHGAYPKLIAASRDMHELHALMAPRPFFVSGGQADPPFRWKALNHAIAVNRLLGYENRVGMSNRPEHSPNDESNEQIYTFFEHFLKPGSKTKK